MADMPQPGSRVEIQLDRHDQPREVSVEKVYVDAEEMLVEYPGTSPGSLFSDIQERVPWSAQV